MRRQRARGLRQAAVMVVSDLRAVAGPPERAGSHPAHQLGDDVVNAGRDQPEAEYQGHDDDDLVGMGVDPVPRPGLLAAPAPRSAFIPVSSLAASLRDADPLAGSPR